MRSLAVAALLASASACLESPDLSAKLFPCRSAADCVSGYVCHPSRFVCVSASEAIDASPADASVAASDAQDPRDADALDAMDALDALTSIDARPTADASAPDASPDATVSSDAGQETQRFGEPCGPLQRCAEGTCVDDVCCRSICDGLCERCAEVTGECGPIANGRDPDGDCPNLDCSTQIFGLQDAVCYAYDATIRRSTCDGARACTRPASCEGAPPGIALASCAEASCVRPDACVAGASIDRFDSTNELCGGPTQRCPVLEGEGCCSPTGACCPSDQCAAGCG